jgi:hypothetical protein
MGDKDGDTLPTMASAALPNPPEPKTKIVIDKIQRMCISVVTIAAEIAIVGVIGATIGSHFSASTIVQDCSRVGIAKVGDTYVNCSVVETKKDSISQPPR